MTAHVDTDTSGAPRRPARPQPDKEEMLRALAALFEPGDVVELRALYQKGRKRTDAGYYDGEHRQALVEAAAKANARGAAVYVTLNQIDPQLISRYANRVEEFAQATATDANVMRRRWMLVDFDPRRPKDTSATDEQLQAALDRAEACYWWAREEHGWPEPIRGASGNGAHLLYPVDLPNDAEATEAIKGALAALARRFDDDVVTVDQAVFNAGRISKLFGTVANKGDDTAVTPWRLSKLIAVPERTSSVTLDQLRALQPEPERAQHQQRQSTSHGRGEFNIEDFLGRLGIGYTRGPHNGSERYLLDHCPFNPDHGKGEAAIFVGADGRLGFKCQHNGCVDRHWADVRELVDGPRERRAAIEQARQPKADAPRGAGQLTEDSAALAFVAELGTEYRYVAPWSKWLRWDGKRWREDSTGKVYAAVRKLIRDLGNGARRTATAAFVSGVERLARIDQSIVVVPEDLDADPWLLNTQGGIVDLRTGVIARHDRAALCTKITTAAADASQGAELWRRFLTDITLGDAELAAYLQRVAGYCATGVTTEDVLPYFFGIGSNGKGTLAESCVSALGDYAKVFAAEVLMESKGERHPTDLAQFMGARLALTSEPASDASWNDARIKHLTGDAEISARFMRADFFTFRRTHKTIVIGNHMPGLSSVTHAIRRRVQMVPFRAVFVQTPGRGMRERLREEAGGAVLAWIVEGARLWLAAGTKPPKAVTELTEEYLSDQDVVGQWIDERCERDPKAFERSSDLHKDYAQWAEACGAPRKGNRVLSSDLMSAGFRKRPTMVGKVFDGLRLKSGGCRA